MSVVVFRIGLTLANSVLDQAYGSSLASGRWHSLRTGAGPRRVIYTAGTRALAQLEKRVHANGIAPVGQALFRVILPDGLIVPKAEEVGLSPRWRDSEAMTQAFGDQWLDSATDLALWVPSYVEPAEHNLLINAAHPRLSEIALVKERDPFENCSSTESAAGSEQVGAELENMLAATGVAYSQRFEFDVLEVDQSTAAASLHGRTGRTDRAPAAWSKLRWASVHRMTWPQPPLQPPCCTLRYSPLGWPGGLMPSSPPCR